MKRLPAAFWICLPLLVALLYVAIEPLFESELEHASMAPPGAVLVERFKDLDTFDRTYYFPLGPGAPSPSAILGVENNVKGLPGVDRGRPLYLIKMAPRAVGTDPALVLFPLSDAEAFETTFMDPEMLERGLIRRAKYLERHGDWAAVAARRTATRQVGAGSLHAAQRGEDFSIAAYLPGLAAMAVANRSSSPWRGVLDALVDADGEANPIELKRDLETGEVIPIFTKAPRLARILETWRIARLWSWRDERRVEVELEALDPKGLPLLLGLTTAPDDDRSIPAPPSLQEARMWLRIPSAPARIALIELLHTLGVDVPEGLRRGPHGGGLLAIATRAAGYPYAASFAIATPRATPLDLSSLVGPVPPPGERIERPAGTLPLTLIDTGSVRPSPAGLVAHEVVGALDIVGIGASAPTAITRLRALLERTDAEAPAPTERDGWHLIASFGADQRRAEKILGSTIAEHGLFGALRGEAVRGEIRTNGRIVRIRLTAIK